MQIQCLSIPKKMFSDFGALRQDSPQILDKNSVRTSGKEHDRLMRGKIATS